MALLGNTPPKASKSPLVNDPESRPQVKAMPTPRTSVINSPNSPRARRRTRVKSVLRTIQFCLGTLFCVLLISTVNLARFSGNIMEAVEVEVQDGKASVLLTLQRFKRLKKFAIKKLAEDDDDRYVKITKEDYLKHQQHLAGNLKGTNNSEEKRHQEAQQMEGAGDEMDAYKAAKQDKQPKEEAVKEKAPTVEEKHEVANKPTPKKEKKVATGDLFEEFAAKDNPRPKPKTHLQQLQHLSLQQLTQLGKKKPQQQPAAATTAKVADTSTTTAAADNNINKEEAPAAPADIEDILAQAKELRHQEENAKTEFNPAGIPVREKRHYDNRWEMSDKIPGWMKDYFVWQDEARKNINQDNWKDYKYLVMTCLTGQVCGNVAHRLRPIPSMIRVGYNSGRIFLIHWGDDDHKLETFLEPPHHGGLDWSLPEYMVEALTKTSQWEDIEAIDTQSQNSEKSIVSTMVQDNDFAEPYYNSHIIDQEVPAEQVFHDVFNVLFKPTSMLYERVEETHHTMGIFRGNFASVHIDYEDEPKTAAEKKALAEKVQNAMNCVSNLRPGGPILVAAQTFAIASEAVKYAKKHRVTVAARQVAHDTATLPHDVWNSFLEIYFMANSRCVAYGKAGYGQLGYIMGYDYNCKIDYNAKQCTWTNTQEEVDQLRAKAAGAALPHEQANDKNGDDDALHLHKDNVPKAKADVNVGMPKWLGDWWKLNQANHANDQWMSSKTLPEWLKAYFSWHAEVRPTLTEKGWKDKAKFIVLTCYAEQHCGNVPNRMRPLPAHLRVAAETKRLLLIHWDKPNPLDTFVAPAGAIDWTVPEYMMWKVRASAQQNDMDVLLAQSKQWETRKVVNSMYNADDEGNEFYDDRRDKEELEAEHVLRDIWHVLFTPTPELQKRIDEMLDQVKLKPGEFSVAHIDDPRVPGSPEEGRHLYQHVTKAINCLSQIAPGQPYLVFSETFEGSQMVGMYGREKGIKIPAKTINHEKHLIPHDLMGSFAEVYVFSMGKCVAYNNGGFGRLGYSLQEDYSCKIRYSGAKAQTCEWDDGTNA